MKPRQTVSGKRLSRWASSLACVLACLWTTEGYRVCHADDGIEFFETKIRPVLIEYCYKCHSAESQELRGELRLDLKAGWQLGGESGVPSIVPGNADESPLIRALRHDDDASAMPPSQPRLPDAIIEDFIAWVQMGASDPRGGEMKRPDKVADWESTFQDRLDWWSLKPVSRPAVPNVQQNKWPRNDVDRFILARLESAGLRPVPEADRG